MRMQHWHRSSASAGQRAIGRSCGRAAQNRCLLRIRVEARLRGQDLSCPMNWRWIGVPATDRFSPYLRLRSVEPCREGSPAGRCSGAPSIPVRFNAPPEPGRVAPYWCTAVFKCVVFSRSDHRVRQGRRSRRSQRPTGGAVSRRRGTSSSRNLPPSPLLGTVWSGRRQRGTRTKYSRTGAVPSRKTRRCGSGPWRITGLDINRARQRLL
jgi:hypothetical protein